MNLFLLAIYILCFNWQAICQSLSPISNLNYLATVGQCNYYDSFENYKKCGSTGFTIAVGFKYCEKLDASSDFLNDDGKLWLNSTRRCLINKLHSYINLKCDVLDNYAYETILPCILNPGYNSKSFCDIVLNWKNVRALLNAYDFANPLTLNGLNKFWSLIATCSEQQPILKK